MLGISIAVIMIGALVVQYVLGRYAPAGAGFVVPILALGFVVYLAINGHISGVRDWLLSALVVLLPLSVWSKGDSSKNRTSSVE